LSISAQLKALRKYAAENGYKIVREYSDEAESGRTSNRPVFQEMIREAKRPESPFEVILVWKLSRFARNREDSIIYKSLLRKHRVRVISINEPVDDSATGQMFEGIIEVMDEFYSNNLAQDVTRGMREASSRGFWMSSGSPYGYRRIKVLDGAKERVKLEPDADTTGVVEQIFELAGGGQGVKEIAKWLNGQAIPSPGGKLWSKGQVHRVLTNPAYTGTLVWGAGGEYHRRLQMEPIRVEGAFPAIIDADTFQRVRAMLHARAPKAIPPARPSESLPAERDAALWPM
jgi:DNA invertase Pin-like site-specific DNA recombinase